MHHLHPRSRMTSTLFTTTLAISFLVVALPHILPCPVDRRQFADTMEMPNGTVRRRRRKKTPEVAGSGESEAEEGMVGGRPPRECPVPKPTGVVGQLMGFMEKDRAKPAEVVVHSLRTRRPGTGREKEDIDTR